MATAKPQPLPPRHKALRRLRWRTPLVLALLALVALAGWFWTPITSYADAGSKSLAQSARLRPPR